MHPLTAQLVNRRTPKHFRRPFSRRLAGIVMSDSSGYFVWYDLMTTDPKAAMEFYTKVMGWGTQDWPSPMPYTMWTVDGNPIGGVAKQNEEQGKAPPHWLASVAVKDVDRSVERVKELGGSVHFGPDDIPDTGRFAVIQDPQGAFIGLYQGREDPGAPEKPTRGKFSWHELTTSDHNAAFDFYAGLFGWAKTTSFDMEGLGTYQMYGKDGRDFGGMFTKPADMPMPTAWLSYVMVDDVKRTAERITELGGKIINGPMEVPGGDWIAVGIDPQGATFAVHAPPAGGGSA